MFNLNYLWGVSFFIKLDVAAEDDSAWLFRLKFCRFVVSALTHATIKKFTFLSD